MSLAATRSCHEMKDKCAQLESKLVGMQQTDQDMKDKCNQLEGKLREMQGMEKDFRALQAKLNVPLCSGSIAFGIASFIRLISLQRLTRCSDFL